MQAPSDNNPDLLPLICGGLSGFLLAGMLLASGLAKISLGVPLLVGSDASEAPGERASRP